MCIRVIHEKLVLNSVIVPEDFGSKQLESSDILSDMKYCEEFRVFYFVFMELIFYIYIYFPEFIIGITIDRL